MDNTYAKTLTSCIPSFETTITPPSEELPTLDWTGLDNEEREFTDSGLYSTDLFQLKPMSSEDWERLIAEFSDSWASLTAESLDAGICPHFTTSLSLTDGSTGPSQEEAEPSDLSEETTRQDVQAKD